ncbi:hypothetical protein CFN78_12765 [Amycolatopsis antarctica]|uniref:AB hydrolase-1 domain-containing protein n=2 Tax=Amycolatopsis antarctica TaxID=1854586 RepID=A0A263D3M4_9PSEU|nr:hypothetical protein CFN78_12765 [Amycolatopsis antarctica]
MPGELVRVGGQDVHVLARRQGEGPTVVFENAMMCPSPEWAWVAGRLGPDVPYVAYDRPGTGWSSPAGPQSAKDLSARLLNLLTTLGMHTPYILVGHSVGGLLIRDFARRYPDSSAGLVFVDSSHPDQLARSAQQRNDLPWVRACSPRICVP